MTRGAIARLSRNLSRDAPAVAGDVMRWLAGLSRTGRPEDYFREARAYILLVPWWAEKSIAGAPDSAFHSDLVYSSVNACYFVRLIDNLMDEHGESERRLLPIVGFFHSQFQSVYTSWFPPGSRFWRFFDIVWAEMAEAAIMDAGAAEMGAPDFARIAVPKSAGVKIPIAAICLRYGREDILPAWCAFYDALSCWYRMLDDIYDCLLDLRNGVPTYFLSEARRRKRPDESVAAWIVREGFAWACGEAEAYADRSFALARGLGSAETMRYLEYRKSEAVSYREQASPGLERLAGLARVLE